MTVKLELRRRLDAVAAGRDQVWQQWEAPIAARATYETGRLMLRGSDRSLNLFAGSQNGISMPTEQLARLIYVPDAVLKIDHESKRGSPQNGIALTSYNDLRLFKFNPHLYQRKEPLLNWVWSGEKRKPSIAKALVRKEQPHMKLTALKKDKSFQEAVIHYARLLLSEAHKRNERHRQVAEREDHVELHGLTEGLISGYAEEMGVDLKRSSAQASDDWIKALE